MTPKARERPTPGWSACVSDNVSTETHTGKAAYLHLLLSTESSPESQGQVLIPLEKTQNKARAGPGQEASTGSPSCSRLWWAWLSGQEARVGSICLQTVSPQGDCCCSILLFTKAANTGLKKDVPIAGEQGLKSLMSSVLKLPSLKLLMWAQAR